MNFPKVENIVTSPILSLMEQKWNVLKHQALIESLQTEICSRELMSISKWSLFSQRVCTLLHCQN
jgi:hypothetical protein